MEEELENKNAVSQVEIQVSQIIGRLEEAVIKKNDVVPQPIEGEVPEENGTNETTETPTHQQDSVMRQLEELFLNSPDEEDGDFVPLPEISEVSRLSVTCHAIAALSGAMERSHVAYLSHKISRDTAHWITDLFRCPNWGVCFHDDQLEGLIRIIRCLLHSKVPQYSELGYLGLKNKQPIIYSSVAAPAAIVQYICRQLGLALSCINAIPCNTLFGSQKMDIAALERAIEADVNSESRLPLIVLADAGSPIAGHVENLSRLQEICLKNDIWLHLRGHSLAALVIPDSSSNIGRISDSMTLPLGIWLGIPGLPTATVYDHDKLSPVVKNFMDQPSRKLSSLPIWAALQSLGKEEIKKRFKEGFEWCHQLWHRLNSYSSIRLLSQPPGGEGGVITISDISSKPINSNILFEVTSSAVVFQFTPENLEGRVPAYYDKLNSWLGQMLMRDCPQINITLCEIESGEVVLRYCPLEPHPFSTEPPDFDAFLASLQQQIEILGATVKHKIVFQRLVESSAVLRLVEVDGWAGLGGVRYQPSTFRHMTHLTDHAKHQLNSLNISLVERLRSTDQAFSLGEGGDGLACVRFGMVTSDTDVSELLSLVEAAGQEEEQSTEVLDTMAEVVKRGIEAATLDLQRESDEALWQEGILRHVPVVGTFVNWWSPNSRPSAGIKGRSLDLTAGIVASTENIYRYHMQASPNQPLEQTSVGHSRSSSLSSSHQTQS